MMAVDVADTGIGISQDKIEQIFDPFIQAEASTTRRFGGTGLGLTISRRFARAMGGDIVVRTELGKGSVFSLTFDPGSLAAVRMLSPDAARTLASHADRQHVGIWEFPPSQVLVVDDSDVNRELVRVLLKRNGIRVLEARNGEECVLRAQHEHFDAILMDMQMPVMDGYTATRLLRERDKRVPIIAMTAHAMAGFENEILAIGCTGYLAKPLALEKLLSTLAGVLGGRRSSLQPFKDVNEQPIYKDKGRSSDLAPLVSRWADDAELHSAARIFVKQVPAKLGDIRRAWRARDFGTLALVAHWLKGSGGTAGFPDFTAPAKLLEELAKSRTADQIEHVIAQLEQLAARMAVFYGSDTELAAGPAAAETN
jgi:CheY-like chemotaxis protein